MTKRLLVTLLILVEVVGFGVMAQDAPVKVDKERVITGRITSKEDNQGVPGANVVIQGTSKGTSTDADGKYELHISPSDNELVISFIGYKTQTVEIGQRAVIDIVLESEATQLQEVVVVGYGVQKKSDITGATATVKGEELYKQPVLTATQAIQGKVAGVQIISSGQPGTSPQIRVRGVSSAFGGVNTLYVVDGVLTDDISNINTADIVDMNILKDASAAAIYGSRGANGVVIITTRKGTKGNLKVNYSNNIGFRQAANLVEMANAAEYKNYVQDATGNAPVPPGGFSGNTNWYKVILRNALEQSHNLSLSGGSDKSTFLFNVGYLDDQGIIIDNEFKRLTIRLNNDYQVTDFVKLGFQSSYSNSSNQNGFGNLDIDAYGNIGAVYNDAYRAAPIIPDIIGGKYGNTSSYQNVGNPLLDIKNNSVKVLDGRLQAYTYAEVTPLKWIKFKSGFGIDWRNSLNRLYNYQFNNDGNTFIIAGGNQYNLRSNLSMKNTETYHWVWDNTATISKKIDKNDFTLLVGMTAEKYSQTWFSASRKDIAPDPNLWYINVGDANSSQNDGSGDRWTRNSYLARLNYSYDGKYLVTTSIRYDGSSRLPVQNRWQLYPSLGLAWNIANEAFMQNQRLFDFLKLRVSYGKVGNDQIPTNAFTLAVTPNTPYAFNGSASTATNGSQIRVVIDPNIKWETTEEKDVAVEFSILNSKLSGEINYYNKSVDNLLVNIPVFATTPDFDHLIIRNIGSVQNRGIEFSLNWKDKLTDKLSYTLGGNVTFNQNKVIALNGGQAVPGGGIGASQGFTTLTDNGQPVGSFHVLKVLGVFNTDGDVAAYQAADGTVIQPTAHAGDFKYLDYNNDGKIDDNDRVFAGSYQPKAYYGINLSLNYATEKKGVWDFSMSIYGNAGNQVYNGKKGVRVSGTDNVEKELVYHRWTHASNSQVEPGANVGNLPGSTYFVESGSFVRINNVTVGYSFPLTKVKLRVYATSQNPFTYKKYSGFTAELPGDPLNSGIELSSYPTTRTVALGVNVTF
ncbi:SusC/RagA family TonB-linked outer membrane protein [Cytophagales bacterium WSM2-2]|nr:SusC/RagA family TonB-linked outer membrane protein [Cytophagales bacterium WSM2-2]